jgi:glycosyltransferase, family 2
MSEPLVSIVCISYNHGPFIAAALDGFLMQQTTFPYEIIVSDDASTDNTQAVIRSYQERYPERLRVTLRSQNVGANENGLAAIASVRGRYVAFCEGDDYWTDPHKLQKQVDFLTFHQEYSVCFHRSLEFYQDHSRPDTLFPSDRLLRKLRASGGFTPENLLSSFFIRFNSVMFRWRFRGEEVREYLPPGLINGDVFFLYMHALTGKIGFLDETMSAYRLHPNGIWSSLRSEYDRYSQYGVSIVTCYHTLKKYSPPELQAEVKKGIDFHVRRMIVLFLEHNDFTQLARLQDAYPEYYRENLYYSLPHPATGFRRKLYQAGHAFLTHLEEYGFRETARKLAGLISFRLKFLLLSCYR